jgi:hypothetical protein
VAEQQGTKGQEQKASPAPSHGGQTIFTTTTTRTDVMPAPSGPASYYSNPPYAGYGHRGGSNASWPLVVLALVAVAVAAFVVWLTQQQLTVGPQGSMAPAMPAFAGEPAPAFPESGSGGLRDYTFHVPAEMSWSEVPGAPGFRYMHNSDGTCEVNHPAELPQPPPAGRAWLNQNCLPG